MMKPIVRIVTAFFYIAHLSIVPVAGDPVADSSATSDAPALTDIQIQDQDVVLGLSHLMPYDVFTLDSPARLIIEIPGVLYKAGFNKKNVNSALVRRIRGYQFKENPLISRVVIDLQEPVDYKTSASDNKVTVSLKRNEVLARAALKKSGSSAAQPKKNQRRQDLLASLPKEEVTFDFEGADIRDVVRLLGETSNINMIFGPEVLGTVTIHLKRVPFDEAFSTILNLKGLVATQLGTNILRITTPEILQKERAKAVMFTKTIPINYLKAEEMQKHVQAVMSAAGRRGIITVAPETNSMVVTDTEEGLAQAERLIAQLDKKPRQVMIEARIVEINLNNGFDIGVQWEFGHQDFTLNPAGTIKEGRIVGVIDKAGGGRVDVTDAFGGRAFEGGGGATTIGAIAPGQSGTGVSLPGPTAAGITFGFVKSQNVLTATLAALINQSKAKILSAPKVVTINGQIAKIEAVQDIRFRKSTVSNGVVTSDFETVSAGIILTVTPTVNAEDRITLKIQPESSFPTQQSTEAGPIIRTRTAQTTVVVKDGDTLVIGGLIDDQDSQGVSKVPLLGDIPIIGVFFRSQTNRKIRNELLVFVTPRIVRD